MTTSSIERALRVQRDVAARGIRELRKSGRKADYRLGAYLHLFHRTDFGGETRHRARPDDPLDEMAPAVVAGHASALPMQGRPGLPSR